MQRTPCLATSQKTFLRGNSSSLPLHTHGNQLLYLEGPAPEMSFRLQFQVENQSNESFVENLHNDAWILI